ncbi:Leucyl aminopeptidase yscIV [Mortierella polycephala]|uniref:Peptide hydrolase n=1 Tax=Mortierella polycephala TaxID=41804 RepID=A0A9P6Q073_9FUNG|nr:Leucyl aminopeptidase yscIV [Mortierella polycephala]
MADSTQARETEPLLPTNNGGGVSATADDERRARICRALPYGAVTLVFFVIGVVLLIVLVEPHNADPPTNSPHDTPLANQLRTPAVFGHLQQLYQVALKHNNSRSVRNGYLASAEYVQNQLKAKAADFCEVSTQEFKVPVWQQLEEPQLLSFGIGGADVQIVYQNKVDFQNFRYGGPSAVLKKQAIHGVKNFGCNSKDHAKVSGKIAIIQESLKDCDLWTAAYNAEKAGAVGVLFYNSPTRKALLYSRIRLTAWKEGDPLISIPVLSITHSLGSTLLQNQQAVHLSLTTKNLQTIESTINVLCTTVKQGNPDDTIVIGAHLDSVPEGPGMVDNGSGSSAILEIVLTMARNKFEIRNRIVFGWWGAEEIGLLGSRHYVRDLVKQGEKVKGRIAMNMNFDMLASPNYVPYIHNGTTAPDALIPASSRIDRVLVEYFDLHNRDYEYTEMIAGSDFLPFLLEGIPSGGLLTGAGERKTMEQRTRFGGYANAPLDPCYHQSCDTLENVSSRALGLMSQAALYAITKLSTAKNLREWLSGAAVEVLM